MSASLLLSTEWVTLVYALLHTLWLGGVMAGALFLVLRVCPARCVRLRYGLSLLALAVIVAGGLGAWAWLDASGGAAPGARTGQGSAVVSSARPGRAGGAPGGELLGRVPSGAPRGVPGWPRWVAALWLAGSGVGLLRAARGVLGAGRLRRRCRAVTDARLLGLWEELHCRLGVRRGIRLLVSDEIGIPAALGLFWPAVLLPAALLTGLPAEQMRAILAHELAHIRRWDYAVNLGLLLLEALLFFNPFVWWIARQARLEREACCDRLAARECASPLSYVEALVAVIEQSAAAGAPVTLLAASGPGSGAGSALDRARRLLVPGYLPAPRLRWFTLLGVLALSTLALLALRAGARAVAETVPQAAAAELPPQIFVRITVGTEDGRPFEEGPAMVRAFSARPGGTSSQASRVEAGGGAPVWIMADAETVSLAASMPGYATAFAGPFTRPLEEKLRGVSFTLEKGHAGSLRVVDEAGRPIAGAELQAFYAGPPELEQGTAVTDADGLARLDHLGRAALTVRVTAPGFEPDQGTALPLEAGSPYVWKLHPSRGRAGRVVSLATGRPIGGASVRLAGVRGPHEETHADPEGAPLLATTDAEGYFTLTSLRADSRYYLFVEAPAFGGVLAGDVTAGGGELRVALGPELSARGKVVHGAALAAEQGGRLHVGYTQYFTIGSGKFGVGRQAVLDLQEGEGAFSLGPLCAEDVDLQVGRWHARLRAAELPKSGVVIDLAKPGEDSP